MLALENICCDGGLLQIFLLGVPIGRRYEDAFARRCAWRIFRWFRRLAISVCTVLFGLGVVVLSGCATKRSGYDVPEIPLPAHYRNALTVAGDHALVEPAVSSSRPASRDSSWDDWWRAFGNAELSALIDRGIANNSDVRIATLKIAQAKAIADQARADLLPSFAGDLGESIQAPAGQVGSVPVVQRDNKKTQKVYQASAVGNWRVDLWGERSALAESARLQVWQAFFERDNVQATMVANLASTYVEYLSLNDRLRIALEADEVLTGVLETIDRRVEGGDATIIELEQQKAVIFAIRATIPNLEQKREEAIATIASLLGTVPGALTLSADGLDALVLPRFVASLPSSLLLSRPDVRAMEAKLLAADADIDVARARLLPPLDLSTQVGYSSLKMASLFQPANLFWNVISDLTVSIFDSGKLESQKERMQTVHEEMVESYARVIIQAMREVETALATIRLTAKRLDAQKNATAAAQRAWENSNNAYSVGGVDHLTLLDAGRTYLRYLDEYQSVRMERCRGYIQLLKALGSADTGTVIPGKGARPKMASPGTSQSPVVSRESREPTPENIAWPDGTNVLQFGGRRDDEYWQVELPGLYARSSVGPTLRDLRTRYPQIMQGRTLHPRLSGQIGDNTDEGASWYRLYVARFATPATAEALCAKMRADFQRCRVVSATFDAAIVPDGRAQAGRAVSLQGPVDEKKPSIRTVEKSSSATNQVTLSTLAEEE